MAVSRLRGPVAAISATVTTRGTIVVAGLLTSILTARALGPDGRGQYFTVTTIAAILAQFGNLGLSSSNVFLAARNPESAWPLTVNSFWLSIIVGIVVMGCVAVFGVPLSRRFDVPLAILWMITIITPAILLFTLGGSILDGSERFAALNGWHLVNAILALALLTACLLGGVGVTGFTAATAIAAAVAATGLVAHMAMGAPRSWRVDAALFRSGVPYAGKAYLVLLLGYLLQRLGVTLLAWFQAPSEIGQFSVALQIHDVLIILPGAIGLVLFPRFVQNPGRAWDSARAALGLAIAVMAALCAVAAAIGGVLIPALFGESFAPAYKVMLGLLPAVLLVSATTVLSQFLVAKGFPGLLIVAWLAGVLVSVLAGLRLVPIHGAFGAAIAQSLGAFVVFLGVCALTFERLGVERLQAANGPSGK